MKINGNEGRPLSILFRGCSFLLLYEAGVLDALQKLSPGILKSASRIYGASSGSIIATLALCEYDKGYLAARKIPQILKDFLNKRLPANAHQLVSGRLHIVLTRLHDWRNVVVSEFASREDLIQAVRCSCFIALYYGLLPPAYHGVRYVDGELSMWQGNITVRTTISVSPFAGEYDICPKDGSAAFFNCVFSDSTLQISERNICRFLHIFLFPTDQVHNQFYTDGYQDTVSFLKKLSEFGINYLDEDFLLSLSNESCQNGEGTVYWKPETRVLRSRATDPEDDTEENPGTIQAADEVEEEAPHHLLHHQKGPRQPQKSAFDPTTALGSSSSFKQRKSNLQPSLQTDTTMH